MTLSFIIAAYNCGKFLEKCIISCLSQDIQKEEIEIIVINDGSTDETNSILERLLKNIDNLIIINQPNKGLGAARNAGLAIAKGEYIWFIDADDYIDKNCLAKLLKIIVSNDLDILALNYFIENEAYSFTGYGYKYEDSPIVSAITTGSEYYQNNYLKNYSWQYIFKRTLFTENNLFFKERINMQDSEIMPKILFHTKRIAYLPDPIYHYVQRDDSFTNSQDGEKRYNYFKSIIEVDHSLSDFADKIKKEDSILYETLLKKTDLLHMVIFNHLIYFRYGKKWLRKILILLKENGYYPLNIPHA